MKRRNKLTLGLVGLGLVALFATGCTANFCLEIEKSRIAYALEPGISEFVTESDLANYDSNEFIYNEVIAGSTIHQIVRAEKNENGEFLGYKNSTQLNSIITAAKSSGILVPTHTYFVELDKIVFNLALQEYNTLHPDKAVDLLNPNTDYLKECLDEHGYLKFYSASSDNAFDNYKTISVSLRDKFGYSEAASVDFDNHYMSAMNTTVSAYHSSITVYPDVKYGNYNGKQITLKGVSWGDAWGKGGHLIEGLIVYPVAWLIDNFALIFAGGVAAGPEAISAAYATGVPQILSILIVTIIVRLFIFLVTFKSVLSQKKMTDLQPEITKIQQKYPNANTNQAQKQRLAEETMRLYKKNKVNPLSQLLVLVVQFPIFIGVWGAMTGSAVLSTGTFLQLDLSASIWDALKLGPAGHAGWWTALVLILLMSLGQFFAMKVPQWIQKAKSKKVARLGKNPAQTQQNRTANIVSYAMLVMIIIMGFTLPAAMGVYWFVGAIVSLIQTVFTNVVFAGGKKKK